MAFRQQHRPQSARQVSYHEPPAEIGTESPHHRKRALEESEEWVLFSPGAPSTAARTHTTSTERTPRTAGLSRLSDFGSLDTAARSQDDDQDYHGTEEGEELDSLDDGLHAFHEPSEYAGPAGRLQQSGDTVLPTHDGLGTFQLQPDADVEEHMWQFERSTPRRRQARRRSSVQRRLDALEETEELHQEQDRRQRIEQWRLDQSRALLEEIERETRRRRRMSLVSAARSSQAASTSTRTTTSNVARSVSDGHSDASDEGAENLSFWQRLTRRVIRDLMGIDEDTLSVIFGEALPDTVALPPAPSERPSIDATLQAMDAEDVPAGDAGWQHRLLERVARELGILVHQLSEHPGAFATYRAAQDAPEYVGSASLRRPSTTLASETAPSPTVAAAASTSTALPSAHFAPTFPSHLHPQHTRNSEASLWGIEEEPPTPDPLDSFRGPPAPSLADDLAREQAYWERELDVKMVFTFLLERFSSRRGASSSALPSDGASHRQPPGARSPHAPEDSARRAAIIRMNHPLVASTSGSAPAPAPSREDVPVPTSSGGPTNAHAKSKRRDGGATTFKTYYAPQRSQGVRSSSSVTSAREKGREGRNYWDFGGSVGSGSLVEGKA